jgi:peptidoglycan-associated lipoprotein
MHTSPKLIAVITAAALLAACGQKAVEAPPPPPPPPPVTQAPAETPAPVVQTPMTPSVTPGTQEDLIQTVGTDRVLFDYDSFGLDDEDKAVLAKQADWLKANSGVRVTIEGHCDERGTREYNLALGDRRAAAVKTYLVGLGIGADRLATISYGKEKPEALGSDDSAWAQNRRAVTMVTSSATS